MTKGDKGGCAGLPGHGGWCGSKQDEPTGNKGAKHGRVDRSWQHVIGNGMIERIGHTPNVSDGRQLNCPCGTNARGYWVWCDVHGSAYELLEACKWYQMACEDVSAGQSKGYFQKAMELGRIAIAKAEQRL